jgi:DNA invertase Pin-like site-specific DNA recombinase
LKKVKPRQGHVVLPDSHYDPSLIGYARVSTIEQNLDMQLAALMRAGVHPDNIHSESVSGVSAKRPALDMARRQCREGMTFVTWKLDRVGRSLLYLLRFIEGLENEGVKFKSIQDQIDTATPIGKFFIAMIGAVAEFERNLIAERTQAGVKRAMERGVKFGQPTVITDKVREIVERELAAGKSAKQAAEAAGIAESTLRKWWKADDIARAREGKKPKRR